MPVVQSFNKRINAWVKYKVLTNKSGGKYLKILNVKQKRPGQKFKGVKVASTSSRK